MSGSSVENGHKKLTQENGGESVEKNQWTMDIRKFAHKVKYRFRNNRGHLNKEGERFEAATISTLSDHWINPRESFFVQKDLDFSF